MLFHVVSLDFSSFMRWITWVLLFFMKAVDVNISLCRLEPGCKQGKQGKNSQFFFKWCLRGSSAQTSCFLQVISILTWSPSDIALRIHHKYNFNFFCFELMPLKVAIKKIQIGFLLSQHCCHQYNHMGIFVFLRAIPSRYQYKQ